MKQTALKAGRFLKTTAGHFLRARCAMLAAGLTYYTMLALVPVLCISLVTAKLFDADDFAHKKLHAYVESLIDGLETAPDDPLATVAGGKTPEERKAAAKMLATWARDVEGQVFDTIGKIDFKTLGIVGFLMLAWSVIGSIGMVETSFNAIWEIDKGRPLWKSKLVDAGMALALPAMFLPTAAAPALKLAKDIVVKASGAIPFAGGAGEVAGALIDSWLLRTAVAAVFAALALAFAYRLLPAAKSSFGNAFRAGLAAAILSGAWLKLCAVAQIGIANASTLYGSLAFLPIMLAWIYMAWQIILLGCCIHRTLDEKEK